VAWWSPASVMTVSGAAQRSGSGRRRWTIYSREKTSTHSDALLSFMSKLYVRRRLRAARSPWASLRLATCFMARTSWRHMLSRSAVLGGRRPDTPSPTDPRYCFKLPYNTVALHFHSVVRIYNLRKGALMHKLGRFRKKTIFCKFSTACTCAAVFIFAQTRH